MKPEGQQLLNLMFREGETVCVSDNEFGYLSVDLKDALGDEVTLISHNPKSPDHKGRKVDTDNLKFVGINPIRDRRLDANCYQHRNFMIELDVGSINNQIKYIKAFKIPYSAMVFSGGKSVHTLIALEEPLKDEKEYRYYGQWILNILTLADKNLKNPSRCFRIPGALRGPNSMQTAIEIGCRVKNKDFLAWLLDNIGGQPQAKEKKIVSGQQDYDSLSTWARKQLANGIEFKNGRNATWFALAVDFAMAGFDEDATIEILSKHFTQEHTFKEKEFLAAINSGFKHVLERGAL